MKLELKHLAPYLPYGLKFYVENVVKGKYTKSYSWELTLETDLKQVLDFQNKPILRPLSDLTEEIENFRDKPEDNCLVMDNWIDHFLDFTGKVNEANINACPYGLMQILLENHFDIFGLIEKGLAIDINTLE